MPISPDTPLPQDPDDGDESPYRRRPRAVAVSRRRLPSRAWRLLRGIVLGAFVVLPLAYGGLLLVSFACTSPLFELGMDSDLLVAEGNHFVTRQELLDALAVEAGAGEASNIFRLRLDQKRKQVEAIPWVRSATLVRAYPHRLVVRVMERTPLAFVNIGGRVKLIDAEGAILEKPERGAFDFPVLDGLGAVPSAVERQSRLALYQQFTHDWAAGEGAASGWMVSEVDLSDPEDLKTLLVQGQDTILVHFGHKDFARRFHTFVTLLPEVRKTTPKIDSVDLRYRGQLIVNPESQEAPAALPGNESGARPPGTAGAGRLAADLALAAGARDPQP